MTVSVRDLKTFIEAIELIGGEDWHPDLSQWNKIRAKIMELEEPAAPVYGNTSQPLGHHIAGYQQSIHAALPPQHTPALFEPIPVPPSPHQPKVQLSSSSDDKYVTPSSPDAFK